MLNSRKMKSSKTVQEAHTVDSPSIMQPSQAFRWDFPTDDESDSPPVPKRCQKRKLDEISTSERTIDFSSEVFIFHVSGGGLLGGQEKTYRVPQETFKLAFPNFDAVYDKLATPHDNEYDVPGKQVNLFEMLLHWAVYGKVHIVKADLVRTTNKRGLRVEVAGWKLLDQLHREAKELKAIGLQNAAIDCFIDRHLTTGQIPWDLLERYVKVNSTKGFIGLKKLMIDMLIHTEHNKEAVKRIKVWEVKGFLSRGLVVELMCGMMDKTHVPPFVERPSQYYV